MKKASTVFLKAAVFLMGLFVFILCIFWLPWEAGRTANLFPEFAYLQYPVLIGMYITAIPFFFALYRAFLLLIHIDRNNAFSEGAVKALIQIKYCAITISVLYVIGSIFLMSQSALHPGIALLGLIIIFASAVVAVFAAVLEKLLKNALDMKSETDLTI